MSTNQPPTGPPPAGPPPSGPPPSGPPSGPPPSGQPWGPPPASPPQTEILAQGGGGPLPPTPPTGSGSGGGKGKWFLIGGGVIGALALGIGGAFAYAWLNGNGPQPAEALPADTLGYVSVDLDPNGKQKIEAYNTLKKFPAAEEWLEEEGLEADDDLVAKAFEESDCEGVDYADDIEPWLGKRFAFAAIGQGQGETPAPVAVVQVSDTDKAEVGVEKLIEECDGDDQFSGYATTGEWLVMAESDDIADQAVEDAEQGSLADDDGFQTWTGEAGDPGILTAYMSDGAGAAIAEQLGSLGGLGGLTPFPSDPAPMPDDDLYDLPEDDSNLGEPDEDMDEQLDAATSMLEGFGGGALTVRFDDGSLEVEVAGDVSSLGIDKMYSGDQAAEIMSTLPADTAAAYSVSFDEGWGQQLFEYIAKTSGGEADIDEVISEAEDELGISLPDDLETLLGEAAVLSVGSDIEMESMFGMSGYTDVPAGVKVRGDADAIEEIVGKVKDSAPSPEQAEIIGTAVDGDQVVIGPNEDYRDFLLSDDGLGGDEIYQDVVREDDASSVLFVNFDAGDGWLEELAASDEEAKENLAPLAGFGAATWSDGDAGHGVLRLTTN